MDDYDQIDPTSAQCHASEPQVHIDEVREPPRGASSVHRPTARSRGRRSPARYSAPTPSSSATPRRVLVLSADIGGGHNATALAIEEAVRRRWPGSEIQRLDTLDVMGRGVGTLFRKIYVSNVETTPWLYEFFYSSLWRHRWFARSSKRFTGSWAGRRLIGPIDRHDPDLIISTYPLGSAGIAWLRRYRALTVPAAAYVSDFAPHPFWVYSELDVNFVMHETAQVIARAAEPAAAVSVSAPPVPSRFRPGDQQSARAAIGARPDAFVALVTCGSLAFGDTAAAVLAILDASAEAQVIAVCGRNEPVLRQLRRLGLPPERLISIGWTADMPQIYQSADLVVTNAGGATTLEALAVGTPVLMFSPIAAHGIANAELMVVAGLADLVMSNHQLTAYVRSLIAHRHRHDELRLHQTAHVEKYILDATLDEILDGSRSSVLSRRPWPMRHADAFFTHVERPGAEQVLGAVLDLAPLESGTAPTLQDVRRAMATRLNLPPLRRILVRHPRPGWRRAEIVDLADHIDERVLSTDADDAQFAAAVGDFWSTPLPQNRPAWRMRLFHGPSDGRSVLAVQEHHSQGDGISALGLLDRLLDASRDDPLRERRPSATIKRPRSDQAVRLLKGIASLANRGAPPRHPLNYVAQSSDRILVRFAFPVADLKLIARAHAASAQETVIAIATDALDRTLHDEGLLDRGRPLRAMVPIAMRTPKLDRHFGNWTGALTINLPIGDIPIGDRITQIRSQLRDRTGRGEPEGAEAVIRIVGHLGTTIDRLFARAVYNRRFLSTIVSFMPAWSGPRWCAGARVTATYPVVPLTAGVPVTIGAIIADGVTGIAVLMDRALNIRSESVHEALEHAVSEARLSAN